MLLRLESPFLAGACFAYGSAMLVFWAQLFLAPTTRSDKSLLRGSGTALLWLGALLHLVSLAGQGPELFGIKAGVTGLFGWLLIVSFLVAGKRVGASGGAAIAPIALGAALFSLGAPGLHSWTPANRLGTLWLVLHVGIILSAYVSLAFAFAFSLLGLLQERLLKRRRLSGLWQRLPSLQIADEWIFRASAIGLVLLTVGILTGIAFDVMDSHGVMRDPKTIFSVLTWTIFAGYLAARTKLGWRGRRCNLFVVYGFVVMAFSFFGVPHLVSQ